MTDVKTLPINEKILFHAHMLKELCDAMNCDKCPLSLHDAKTVTFGCLLENMGWPDGREEIERRFNDVRSKREKN